MAVRQNSRLQMMSAIAVLSDALLRSEQERIMEYATLLAMEKDSMVFYEGGEPSHLHLLIEGAVKIYKIGAKNEETVLRTISSSSLIGELANIRHIPFPASVKCLRSSKILKIDFLKLQEEPFYSEKITPLLLDSIADKLEHHVSTNMQYTYSNLSAKAKTACYLLENIENFNCMRRWEVAKVLNIAPETLSRTLREFELAEVIELSRNHVAITNSRKLEKLVLDD